MSHDEKEYKREYNRRWMNRNRAIKRWKNDIARGHCPVCGMLLISTYHFSCRFLDKEDKDTPL